jgi:hypothetical protein
LRAAAALATLLVVGAGGSLEAGPWGAGRGHFYAKVGGSRLRSTVLAAPDGTEFDIPRFVKEEVTLYGAVGITSRLTAIVNVPAYRSSDLQDFRRESGVGDVQGGLQWQLGTKGPWVFAVRSTVQVPTGDETRADGLLPTGSGVWEGEGVLSAGRSLAGGKSYAFGEAGHQVRGGGLTDAFAYGAQLGWNAHRRLVLAANVRGVEPYDQSPREARGSPVGLSDRVGYVVFGPTVIVPLAGGAGLQLDVEAAARARNLAKGTTVRLGLSLSR